MSGFIYNTIKDQAIVAYFFPWSFILCNVVQTICDAKDISLSGPKVFLLVRKQVGAVAALAHPV